ncbi:helix-turn-helix transcriptional regulator [Kluyvera ascorbata]|uniref:helix-turn-helix transcriptional regulator n=1 Tax=Kluyvera ascorbata TaxID=51288 RepID=UPI0005636910|nr:LuxR C-terminal-related transcriptional regulator [Kluyvera ascorbata]HEB4875945.1 LuxR family transcriptional regulator [Kluyvera ascorbata F0526]EJG2384800.1 LuxR family transcriptional regulator [Kluyvera ascorbata]MDT8700882.1 LuxR C-terminal-related transcriptional regulator [Kluyvera ascorbata]MDU1194748.1 LuxR C-terminal-related transcriptional regulator [Kluyvera ascorbata]MDZ4033677.1 LuxR C-terminal-related transcriptional regulator [Kluyvera ascorbata]
MATSILLVTQDCYLVKGIKIFFPDIIQLSSINHQVFESQADEYSVLIDSRSPLRCYDYLIINAVKARKPVYCVMLDMRQRESQLFSLKMFLNTSRSSGDMAGLLTLFLNMKSKRLTPVWLENLGLSVHEQSMLRMLNAGMSMEEIAGVLKVSVKGLYRERTALYERLGATNFNEACLFIFRNRLLDDLSDGPLAMRHTP